MYSKIAQNYMTFFSKIPKAAENLSRGYNISKIIIFYPGPAAALKMVNHAIMTCAGIA